MAVINSKKQFTVKIESVKDIPASIAELLSVVDFSKPVIFDSLPNPAGDVVVFQVPIRIVGIYDIQLDKVIFRADIIVHGEL